MQGHAAANMVPVIAANRIGIETDNETTVEFYGSSFITNYKGEIIAQANRIDPQILVQAIDLE